MKKKCLILTRNAKVCVSPVPGFLMLISLLREGKNSGGFKRGKTQQKKSDKSRHTLESEPVFYTFLFRLHTKIWFLT
jgi:hypothetical protein